MPQSTGTNTSCSNSALFTRVCIWPYLRGPLSCSKLHSGNALTEVQLSIDEKVDEERRALIVDNSGNQDEEEPDESVVSNYFERGEPEDHVIHLDTVFLMMTDENLQFYQQLPDSFNPIQMLEEMQIPSEYARSEYVKEVNTTIGSIKSKEELIVFCKILCATVCHIVVQNIFGDPEKVKVTTQ